MAFWLVTGAMSQLSAQSDPYDSGGELLPEQAAYDVTYYELEIRVNPADSTIAGVATLVANVLAPMDRLVVDLDPKLAIESVETTEGPPAGVLEFERREGRVWIALPAALRPGDTVAARIAYAGRPRVAPNPPWDGGFTWSATASGEPWVGLTCFGEGADTWRPVKDHPSDEPDSTRLQVRVPNPLVVASNGRLEGVDHGEGWSTFHWFVSTPINNYNVTLNIAPYELVETRIQSVAGEMLPIVFYALPEHAARARRMLAEIIDQLRFYEETLGPYPFRADKYGVAETPYMAMEHQTIIAYGGGFDRTVMTGGVDWGFDALHQHELSHEWWGNLVTAADFKDLWLHEGFGTYMQPLYVEARQGIDVYHAYLDSLRGTLQNQMAVAPRESQSVDEIYANADIYDKGAWILHTLRHVIGDKALRRALRRMAYPRPELEGVTDGSQTRFASTDEFIGIAEDAAGRELDWFFEVYVRRPALPVLHVNRTAAGLELRWEVDDDLAFPMPLFVSVDGTTRRVDMPDGSAVVPVESGAEVVVDPKNWVLKEVRSQDAEDATDTRSALAPGP